MLTVRLAIPLLGKIVLPNTKTKKNAENSTEKTKIEKGKVEREDASKSKSGLEDRDGTLERVIFRISTNSSLNVNQVLIQDQNVNQVLAIPA